jgi:hypothetical protein
VVIANTPGISNANGIIYAIVTPSSSKVGLALIGGVRQTPKSNGLMKMEIDVNDVRVQFYRNTGAEVNIFSKVIFDYTCAPSLQKCDEVARMYNGQTATFLGKGRAVFKHRDHDTEDLLYVAPRKSFNLRSYQLYSV